MEKVLSFLLVIALDSYIEIVIASNSYSCSLIGIVIASFNYRSKLIKLLSLRRITPKFPPSDLNLTGHACLRAKDMGEIILVKIESSNMNLDV
jgi:hypothetical protein